jgi:MFS family permease
MATLALSAMMAAIQQTMVLPLVPDLPRRLDTTADNASWLVTATLLTGAVATPTISRLADMFGKKRMMLVALGVSVLGSTLGILGASLPMLIAARALQGVGMALVPIGIAIMRDELPRDRVPLGVAMISASLAVGAGAGMPFSGLIAEYLNWRSMFWVTAIVGSVLLVAVALVLKESPVRTGGSFDYCGAVVFSTALTALLLALSKGSQWGWTSIATLILAGLAFALLVVWVPVELRVRMPVVDLRLAVRPAILLVNVGTVLTGFAMFANLLVTAQLLQQPASSGYGLGLDILQTGLWMVPNTVVFGVMAPVAASVTRRFGPLMTLQTGSLVMLTAYVARVWFSQGLEQVVVGSMCVAVGNAMAFAALPTLIMRVVPVTETASAIGLNNLLRTVGTAASSATMAAVMTTSVLRLDPEIPTFHAFAAMYWLAGAAALMSALLVIPMRRRREYADESPLADRHPASVARYGVANATTGGPANTELG